MGTNPVKRDATAYTVSANVKRLREKRNLALRGLAKKLADLGRPLTHTAVDQIEQGGRRVDVDDLVALAAALDVSPITLLMPADADAQTAVEATGIGEGVSALALWNWLNASGSLPGRSLMPFLGDALPVWERAQLEAQSGPTMAALMDLRAPGGTSGND